MSDKNTGFPGMQALPTILVAVAVLGSVFLVEKPLQSKRQREKEFPSLFRLAEDSAPAKLWDDPYEAMSRHLLGAEKVLEARSAAFRAHYCDLSIGWWMGEPGGRVPGPPADAGIAACWAEKQADSNSSSQELARDLAIPVRKREEICHDQIFALEEIEGVNQLRREIRKVSPRPGKVDAPVLFVGVALPGGALNERAEYRRRFRIAMVSALDRRGFAAEQEAKLSYLLLPEDEKQPKLTARLESGLQLRKELVPLPYEIFDRQAGIPSDLPSKFGRVVLFWLDQDRLGGGIKEELTRISEMLSRPGTTPETSAAMAIEVALIGPGTSSALVEMLQAEKRGDGAKTDTAPAREDPACRATVSVASYQDIFSQMKIYSAYATAPEIVARSFAGELLSDLVLKPDSRNELWAKTIADDGEVLFALVQELRRRGIDLLEDPKVHVALVTELDSSYGRALPLTFRAAAQMTGSRDGPAKYDRFQFARKFSGLESQPVEDYRKKEVRPESTAMSRIHIFRYLRGLDGIAPTGQPSPSAPADDKNAEKKFRGVLERAEGPSLLDQIRTVGMELGDLDEDLRQIDHRIYAIGILGSDFYDKQLALQALRSAFPDVVFFTTDLDARYLHRDDQEWNRNLLIGSSFGFQLEKSLQGEIPPFRDVYSTSTFLAGLLALGTCAEAGKTCDVLDTAVGKVFSRDPPVVEPMIFEIGITRAHALNSSSQEAGSLQPSLKAGWMIPRGQQKFFFWLTVVIGTACLVSRRVRCHWVLLLGAATYVIFSAITIDLVFADEPAALVEGVSVRGTEMLRMVLIGLAVAILLLLRQRIRDVQETIRPRFAEGASSSSSPRLRFGEWIYISKAFDQEGVSAARETADPEKTVKGTEVVAADEWRLYRDLQKGPKFRFLGIEGAWDRQLIRVGIMTLASFVLLAIFAAAQPGYFEFPLVPVRGARGFDALLRYASLFCLTFACYWTLDTVRLCANFVNRLASGKTVWPDTRKNRESVQRRQIPLSYLGDYLDIRVVAPLAQEVALSVIFPFLLLAIFIVSRARFFDYWTWPMIVGSIVLVLLACIVISAFLLQRAARRVRESTLKFLRVKRTAEADQDTPAAKARVHQLEILIQEVESLNSGAFGPWTSNPVLGALLLPFGGASVATLIEFLLKIGM